MTRTAYPTIGIVQGETWISPAFVFPGDLSDWEPRGQIRSKLLQESGTLLAEFSFDALTYDPDSDETTVTATLAPAQTSALKITRYQGAGEITKTGAYFYDVELESDDGAVVKLAPGAVYVVGEVTGPGVPPAPLETFLIASNNLSEVDPEEARQNLGIIGGVQSDWNAEPGASSEILNKPDLSAYVTDSELTTALEQKQDAGDYLTGDDLPDLSDYVTDSELETALIGKQDAGDYLTPSSLSSYETTTQLNARDTANRDRANHSGTQAINTISGLETALSGKEPADETILKSGAIGNTIQPFNANTVVDSLYNTFTTAEKTKLANIGAQKETIILALTAPGVNIALGEILAINAFPYNLTNITVRADLELAPTGANLVVDMRKGGVSMMINKFIIEATEKSSTTATTPPSLSSNTLAIGDRLSFNVDQIGATVAGQYLTITIEGERA